MHGTVIYQRMHCLTNLGSSSIRQKVALKKNESLIQVVSLDHWNPLPRKQGVCDLFFNLCMYVK